MSVPQIRNRFQNVTRWIVLSAATLALMVAFTAPSFTSADSAITPGSSATHEVQDVAWRGRVYRRGYYARPYVRSYRYGYGPRPYNRGYYGRPYYGGGGVVTPWVNVYW